MVFIEIEIKCAQLSGRAGKYKDSDILIARCSRGLDYSVIATAASLGFALAKDRRGATPQGSKGAHKLDQRPSHFWSIQHNNIIAILRLGTRQRLPI